MLQPKKTKFNKSQKVVVKRKATSCSEVNYGIFGLKVCEHIKITARQLEAMRKVISRTLKRDGLLYMRVFPHFPVTKKALGIRMGGGKSGIEYWVAPVRSGTIIFEVDNVPRELAYEALTKAGLKLVAKCKIVERRFIYLDAAVRS